jgi:hypothetical protein
MLLACAVYTGKLVAQGLFAAIVLTFLYGVVRFIRKTI